MRLFTTYYDSVHDCPISCFYEVEKTNSLNALRKETGIITRKSDATKAWRKLMSEYIDQYGVSDQYAEYLRKMGKGVKLLFDTVSNFEQERQNERLAAIEEELSSQKERADQLRELAAQGNQTASENLALEIQRQAELEQKRAQQIRKQQRQELALAAIKIFAAKADDPNALGSTIADVSALTAFIASLPAFFEGSERVGDDLPAMHAGRDGYLARLDGGERVLTGKQNALIPRGMTNKELAMLAANTYRMPRSKPTDQDKAMLEALNKVHTAIKSQRVYEGMDYDARKRETIDTIRERNKVIRRIRKSGGAIG